MTETEILTSCLARAAHIRFFEERLGELSDQGRVPGLLHLCLGAELFEVILCRHLDTGTDQLTGSHRSHGLALAVGLDPTRVAAEILGREGGLSDGLGGTQHLIAPEDGFLGGNGIVGGQVPMAAGAALSAKRRGTGGIAVTFLGDGAFNQGGVMETMNLASVLELPLLFVVENNGLGLSTAAKYSTAGTCVHRARSFGMAAEYVDGGDVTAMEAVCSAMTSWVRGNGSPALIEVFVPRLSGHHHSDEAGYLAGEKAADPFEAFTQTLQAKGLDPAEIDSILAESKKRAHADIDAALRQPETGHALQRKWEERLRWEAPS